MKYAAAITLYNPQPEYIYNIFEYTKSFPLVIINDNTSNNSDYASIFTGKERIIYLWDGSNHGLPKAFNQSLKICLERGIDYLCTLDQDSKLGEHAIAVIKGYIENHDMSQTAVIAPKPIEIKKQASEDMTEETKAVSWVICSGAFVNVKLLNEKGIAYDEAYFVDRFDGDISKQINDAGLKQLVLNTVEMPHACGDETGHSPLRNYYIFRNRFYYNDKYYSRLKSISRTFLQTVRHCWTLMMNQKDGMKKVKMLPLAYRDYRKGLMGEVPASTLEKIKKISK